MMFHWFEKILKKHRNKDWDDLYEYTLSRVLKDLLEIYKNTWDKQRVEQVIRIVSGINLEAYIKDTKLREEVNKVLKKD